MMSARSPLICSAVELWYKKMLKIGSLSELTGMDIKIRAVGFQRLYSKWLWLLMAVYKPSFTDAELREYGFEDLFRDDVLPGDAAQMADDLTAFFEQK